MAVIEPGFALRLKYRSAWVLMAEAIMLHGLEGRMDMTILSGQLFGLSFFLLWVLLAILFSGVREGLGASPKNTDRVGAEDRSIGCIARYLLAGDRERRATGLAMEAKARCYFGRRIGKIHLTAVAVLAATALLLGVWNLHSAKIHREFRVEVGQR